MFSHISSLNKYIIWLDNATLCAGTAGAAPVDGGQDGGAPRCIR